MPGIWILKVLAMCVPLIPEPTKDLELMTHIMTKIDQFSIKFEILSILQEDHLDFISEDFSPI